MVKPTRVTLGMPQVGGGSAVDAVVGTFYVYLITDPQLRPFFRNVAMGRMRHLQKSFVSVALGSIEKYKGKNMRDGHSHLGISDDHFSATVDHLVRCAHSPCMERCARPAISFD